MARDVFGVSGFFPSPAVIDTLASSGASNGGEQHTPGSISSQCTLPQKRSMAAGVIHVMKLDAARQADPKKLSEFEDSLEGGDQRWISSSSSDVSPNSVPEV